MFYVKGQADNKPFIMRFFKRKPGLIMKKLLAIIFAVALIFQAGAVTVFAENPEKNEQVITIGNINSSLLEKNSYLSSTKSHTFKLPSDTVEIIIEKWDGLAEISISGKNIKVTDGKYSYQLTLRSDKTLTFDNHLEIYYQGINGKYQLNYEIDETDNHIMTVTGTFENIIIASPLLEKISDKNKNYILSHISEDTYSYQLILRTAEGFSFTNSLGFLFDSKPFGYSIHYTYDLLTDKQNLIIDILHIDSYSQKIPCYSPRYEQNKKGYFHKRIECR